MASSLGKLFTITSFGESHGRCVGAVIDGCPAGLDITEADIQDDLVGSGITLMGSKDLKTLIAQGCPQGLSVSDYLDHVVLTELQEFSGRVGQSRHSIDLMSRR